MWGVRYKGTLGVGGNETIPYPDYSGIYTNMYVLKVTVLYTLKNKINFTVLI